jgi:hypothetical protein
LPAGEIEALVLDQLRALLRQPEVVVGTWRAAQEEEADISEEDTRLALERLDEMWGELFPSEQARIFGLMVDRVEVGTDGADVRLRLEGLGSLAREFRPRRAAEIGKAA